MHIPSTIFYKEMQHFLQLTKLRKKSLYKKVDEIPKNHHGISCSVFNKKKITFTKQFNKHSKKKDVIVVNVRLGFYPVLRRYIGIFAGYYWFVCGIL